MNNLASSVPVGSDGLRILPFGNGAERMLNSKNTGASIFNLNFNKHNKSHLLRASLEGIAFSFVYGIDILKKMKDEFQEILDKMDNQILKDKLLNLYREYHKYTKQLGSL